MDQKNLNYQQLDTLLRPAPVLSSAALARGRQLMLLHYHQEFPTAVTHWWTRFLSPWKLTAVSVLAVLVVVVYHHYAGTIELDVLQMELNSLQIPEEQFL